MDKAFRYERKDSRFDPWLDHYFYRRWIAVAATIASRNDEELRLLFSEAGNFDLSFFSNTTASQFFRHFLLKGTLQDAEVLQKRLRRLLGDSTFLESFLHSGAMTPPGIRHFVPCMER